MNIIKDKLIKPLLDSYIIITRISFFLGWLYTFPMFGPVLNNISDKYNIEAMSLLLIFLIFHALGLFIFSFLRKITHQAIIFSTIFIALFTMLCCSIPQSWIVFIIGIDGFFSALIMLDIQFSLIQEVHAFKRGRIKGVSLFLACIILLLVLFIYTSTELHFLVNFLSGLSLLLTAVPIIFSEKKSSVTQPFSINNLFTSNESPLNWSILLLVAFGYYFTSGMIFSMVYPYDLTLHTPNLSYLNTLIYMIIALCAGTIFDLCNRRVLIFVALGLAGIGYLGMMFFTEYNVFLLSLGLTQASSALMDIFFYLTIGIICEKSERPLRLLGLGIFVNIFSVLLSNLAFSFWNEPLIRSINAKYLGIGVLFLLMPIASFMKDELSIDDIKNDSLNTLTMTNDELNSIDDTKSDSLKSKSVDEIMDKYALSKREKEIGLLLIEGYSYAEIESALGIKKTTVKTHLRNIYNKTNASNSKEFILLFLKDVN